jgi:hypothetical protein
MTEKINQDQHLMRKQKKIVNMDTKILAKDEFRILGNKKK